VREVLDTIEEGSAVEGLARIAMLIGKAGSGQRRLSQMQKAREILSPHEGIAHMSEDERRRLLQEETIVVEFEPERAKRSLPKLLRTSADRRRAHALLQWIETQPVSRSASGSSLASLIAAAGVGGISADLRAPPAAKRRPARASARAWRDSRTQRGRCVNASPAVGTRAGARAPESCGTGLHSMPPPARTACAWPTVPCAPVVPTGDDRAARALLGESHDDTHQKMPGRCPFPRTGCGAADSVRSTIFRSASRFAFGRPVVRAFGLSSRRHACQCRTRRIAAKKRS
jgi:hypothetical protein